MGRNKEPVGWITVRGNHIPLYDGDSKQDAIKRFTDAKRKEAIKSKVQARNYVGEHTVYRTGGLDAPTGMVYLSTDKREASHYGDSKDKMQEYKINIKNPLVIDARTYSNSDLEGSVGAYVALGGDRKSVNWEREGEQERIDRFIGRAIKKTDHDAIIIHKRNGSEQYYEIQVPKRNIKSLQHVKDHSKASTQKEQSKWFNDVIAFRRYVEKTSDKELKQVVASTNAKSLKGVGQEVVRKMKSIGFNEAEYTLKYSDDDHISIWGRFNNDVLATNEIYTRYVYRRKNGTFRITE